MDTRRAQFSGAVVVALLAAGALEWWLVQRPEADITHTGVAASAGRTPPSILPEPAARPSTTHAGDRAAREKMRDSIWHAFGRTPPPEQAVQPNTRYVLPSALPDPPAVPGRFEPQHIKERMHTDFSPMASGCYDEARARVPRLQGKIWLRFVLVGDPKIGSVVESADVMDQSTIRDQGMIECIRESMLSMTFQAPIKGGFVTMEYPIDFHPDEPDAR